MHPQKPISVEAILQSFILNLQKKTYRPLEGPLQIEVQPENERWCIVFQPEGDIMLEKGGCEGAFLQVKTSGEVLERLSSGALSLMTAIGRARYSDPAPLDIQPGEGVSLVPGSDRFNQILEFLQRFFNPFIPEKILMGLEHSREIHGGHVVGLFYGKGMRSAWYALNKGERLNNPEDTNPFPQAFIFLAGSGMAQVDTTVCEVKAGEAVHIPAGAVHMVWNENVEPLELLFLAWGEKA